MTREREPRMVRCRCRNSECGLVVALPDDRLLRGEFGTAISRLHRTTCACPLCSDDLQIVDPDVVLFSDRAYAVFCRACGGRDIADAIDLIAIDNRVCVHCKRFGRLDVVRDHLAPNRTDQGMLA